MGDSSVSGISNQERCRPSRTAGYGETSLITRQSRDQENEKARSVRPRYDLALLSSRTKASRAAFSIVEIIGPDSLRSNYFFDYQLTDLAILRQLNSFFSGVMK